MAVVDNKLYYYNTLTVTADSVGSINFPFVADEVTISASGAPKVSIGFEGIADANVSPNGIYIDFSDNEIRTFDVLTSRVAMYAQSGATVRIKASAPQRTGVEPDPETRTLKW